MGIPAEPTSDPVEQLILFKKFIEAEHQTRNKETIKATLASVFYARVAKYINEVCQATYEAPCANGYVSLVEQNRWSERNVKPSSISYTPGMECIVTSFDKDESGEKRKIEITYRPDFVMEGKELKISRMEESVEIS